MDNWLLSEQGIKRKKIKQLFINNFISSQVVPVIYKLTLVQLNPDIPCFANSVDPDQLASEEAN